MDVTEVIDRARDSITVKRVYGEAIHQKGVTMIPAALVAGGGGGGGGEGLAPQQAGVEGEASKASGSGGGFGLRARPAGAFVIREGSVTWIPAVDVNRIVRGAQWLAGTALVLFGINRILRAR
ncbi:spore germination protein GerW family protein [Pyxidicoccus sp. MSG2]|uniref:spore germination protein GerW family protein n=1 Tax=Pyxidicoccus sp. MSG2 TaxID=2996790 RepID=UPI0022700AE9|nr:spore germination protein GerW family protein [Pyxidicoccus sp. MSG2]MCY1023787.1 spore germination protein GerW family protein [Pyxidicoccus sp. MSG2]